MTPLRIAGAGLAGLLAACAWPTAELFDPQPAPRPNHRAVLRFRSDAVARLVGIEFRPVTVRKGVWMGGNFVEPTIQLANYYSRKVLGSTLGERSIWNLAPVERWIAPESLYEQLVASAGKRIRWGTPCDYSGGNVISTAPLPVLLEELRFETSAALQFLRQPIHVERFRVPQCDVYQSVYFPDPTTPVYRASITGDLLIIESMLVDQLTAYEGTNQDALDAFGIERAEFLDAGNQRFGKIVPLNGDVRRHLLHRLTQERGIFSLGRFATWRNVLLDDVVQDIAVVRRLLRASSYERSLFAAR